MENLHRNHPGLIYKLTFLFAFVAVFAFLALKLPTNSEAASLANFKAGNIISDYTMGNYTTMSVADIDAFLHAHGNCNDTNTVKASWYPNLHYHIENGHFVCLADERFSVTTPNYGDLLANGEASKSAAEIIYEAAQTYHINPQVLIVLLEKEQGLVSDSWPNSIQFRSATGFGCPDTAACDAEYYGLRNQVESAAWLFRTVLDGGWTNYPVGENYIRYNPDASCGGSTVYVENLATSSLYRYTPYQPNAGALAAGYGTAYCGAYGNRNFYLYFMDYFGDPTVNMASNAELPSGEYEIVSTISKNLRLTTYNGALTNASGFQTWTLEAGEDFYYIVADGYYLTANNSESLTVASKTSNNNQKWIIHENSDSTYTIYSKQFGTVLDVDNGSSVNGTRVKLYAKTGNNNSAQKWTLTQSGLDETDYTGLYYIFSAGSEKAIDIYAGETANNTNVQVYQQSLGNKAQEWQIAKAKTGDYYTITNPKSGKSLDVRDNKIRNNANVQIYEPNNSCAQRWRIFEQTDGSVVFANACNLSEVLDIQDYKTNLQIYEYGKGNAAQKWQLKKVEDAEREAAEKKTAEEKSAEETAKDTSTKANEDDTSSTTPRSDYSGKYYIISAIDSKALDVYGGSVANGTNIWIYPNSEGNNAQIWRFEKVNGHYIIKNEYSKKVLDIAGGIIRDNSNVWIYAQNNTCAQLWDISANTDGTVAITNACNAKEALDVQDFKTNAQIYQRSNNNSAQKWTLKEVE